MSKIYEALRQAELDRANNTGTPQSVPSQSAGQAVLDDAAAEPVFSREVRSLEPLAPSLRDVSERTVGGALAEVGSPTRSFPVNEGVRPAGRVADSLPLDVAESQR